MKELSKFLLCVCILTASNLGHARLIASLSYEDVLEKADAIVIAKPIATTGTSEKMILPNISPSISVVGVTTEVKVLSTLKGAKLKILELHHYRLKDINQPIRNGPLLLDFDSQSGQYLMYLKKESDGRYAPVAGQTDPLGFSILKLDSSLQ